GRDIGLVAGDAVERLGQHDVELPLPGVLQERLNAWPQGHGGTRDGRILVSVYDAPLLAYGVVAANAELVVNRGDTLIVGGVAGVERNLDHHQSPFIGGRRCSGAARSIPGTSP